MSGIKGIMGELKEILLTKMNLTKSLINLLIFGFVAVNLIPMTSCACERSGYTANFKLAFLVVFLLFLIYRSIFRKITPVDYWLAYPIYTGCIILSEKLVGHI